MITIKEIKKTYQSEVLKGVDFSLGREKVYCLLGRNGSGKTTLMKLMAGILDYDSGAIQIDGDLRHEEAFHYVSEHPVFLEYLSGFENLKFVMRLHRLSLSENELRSFVDKQGISGFADDLVVNYSQGMKHQLSLAIAFLIEPEVLLLDEPLVSLDPINIVEMHKRLKDYAQKGRIVFISTHMLPIAHRLGDVILLLKDGKVKQVNNEFTEKELETFVLDEI
ncbi:ABC transporter ATP-binding protein (plasmid) [Pseudalkalibacillus hwajinpoensis]|uniref:ABC transporter ATP-binding protein n=1 Tax=Guptibacillus hwajinpoensis TaxID=208199 RepID=UPI00325C249C